MRVAVCISGLPRGKPGRDITLNFLNLKRNFPNADFYMGTWKGQESLMQRLFPNEPVWYFDEPTIDYHPYLDIAEEDTFERIKKPISISQTNEEFRATSSHQTKQIIAHALMVDNLPKLYDVIIRARFDTFTSPLATFDPYIKNAYDNKRAIGFACLKHHWHEFNTAHEITEPTYTNRFLFDQLIIHSCEIIDTAQIYALSQERKLLPAEFGWWQILSHNNNHRCVSGWAEHDRSVPAHYLK